MADTGQTLCSVACPMSTGVLYRPSLPRMFLRRFRTVFRNSFHPECSQVNITSGREYQSL